MSSLWMGRVYYVFGFLFIVLQITRERDGKRGKKEHLARALDSHISSIDETFQMLILPNGGSESDNIPIVIGF
ncbi:hypothetical protein J5N97_020310 [Dioscorea zingiberensis]|uniref:Uncharacterized protein n=1 Tax=Dioscorea zingiberensis TaxID=325984 RepID=A0A9D5CFK9_9LILI|nr:hypothetical protein J5N97_020310 [Dioscorea zingiberensis]